ncbi:(2Fe-2S)-binding protein [Streptomyces sp. NPDC057424]|uniref:(2Fe-2S)-binding protein n=1 Tax=Streptomyces sp. NPDC057424 TaxID=3346127 RepID=UPI0036B322AD
MNPPEPAGPGPAFTVTFDGRPVQALPGQTVAAVLWTAGVTSWRSTRGQGRPRGVFCGIGVCFDCLVTVNGRPNQRACLVPVRPGDAIGTQDGTGHEEVRDAD